MKGKSQNISHVSSIGYKHDRMAGLIVCNACIIINHTLIGSLHVLKSINSLNKIHDN